MCQAYSFKIFTHAFSVLRLLADSSFVTNCALWLDPDPPLINYPPAFLLTFELVLVFFNTASSGMPTMIRTANYTLLT
ncbi:MAG: hypothetical protein C4516_07090 [Oxalobacter sp.]|nr:MAG: hypothetical protein C4516_07090 [Oxalobacter sp.]